MFLHEGAGVFDDGPGDFPLCERAVEEGQHLAIADGLGGAGILLEAGGAESSHFINQAGVHHGRHTRRDPLLQFGGRAVEPSELHGPLRKRCRLARKLGGQIGEGAAAALGMAVAALVVLPFGAASGGARLVDPQLLPLALTVAVLSSALPYSLEMFALTRLPRSTFGTLMSLEPAIGALSGLVLLGQQLSLRQGAAIAAIIAASAGAAPVRIIG